MKGVCSTCGMFHVLLATKLSLRSELHSIVIVKTILVYLGIVLGKIYVMMQLYTIHNMQ